MKMLSGEKKCAEWEEMQDILISKPSLKVLLIAPFNPSPPNRSEVNISIRVSRSQYKIFPDLVMGAPSLPALP
jgi:hypothetical protein